MCGVATVSCASVCRLLGVTLTSSVRVIAVGDVSLPNEVGGNTGRDTAVGGGRPALWTSSVRKAILSSRISW